MSGSNHMLEVIQTDRDFAASCARALGDYNVQHIIDGAEDDTAIVQLIAEERLAQILTQTPAEQQKPVGGYGDGANGAPGASAAVVARMEALVRRMAQMDWQLGPVENALQVEAFEIVRLLPEPVDADLLEAREIVADQADVGHAFDDGLEVRIALAAIKRGRALAAGERQA